MSKRFKLDRRTFLRGFGTTIALPFLEAMLPERAYAATAPQRFIAVYLGNGVMLSGAAGGTTNNWESTGTETAWTLARALQPLAPYKADLIQVQGMTNDGGQFGMGIDGGTAHWLAGTTFLTGQNYDHANRATRVALYQPGASIDQLIAARTPNGLKSLVMGTMSVDAYPNSEARGSNKLLFQVSWASQTAQVPRMETSAAVFNRIFAGGTPTQTDQAAALRAAMKKSIFDGVLADANRLITNLGAADRAKMDEFMTSVTEVERRIAAETPATGSCAAPTGTAATVYTSDTNRSNEAIINARVRNMSDLIAIAFKCDISRVATVVLQNEHTYSDLHNLDGATFNAAHHDASHYRDTGSPSQMDFVNKWQSTQVAYLMSKLKAATDVTGTVYDNTLTLFGSGMGDSHDHSFQNTPTLLIGGRGLGMTPGRLVKVPGAKYSNFLQTIMSKYGVTGTVGRSNGTIAGI